MTTEVRDQTPPTDPPGRSNPLLRGPDTKWPVFLVSAVGVLLMALWALLAPDNAESAIGKAVGKVTVGFGWFYVVLATAILVFVVGLAVSRYGHVRLGPDHSRPEYSTFSWAAPRYSIPSYMRPSTLAVSFIDSLWPICEPLGSR